MAFKPVIEKIATFYLDPAFKGMFKHWGCINNGEYGNNSNKLVLGFYDCRSRKVKHNTDAYGGFYKIDITNVKNGETIRKEDARIAVDTGNWYNKDKHNPHLSWIDAETMTGVMGFYRTRRDIYWMGDSNNPMGTYIYRQNYHFNNNEDPWYANQNPSYWSMMVQPCLIKRGKTKEEMVYCMIQSSKHPNINVMEWGFGDGWEGRKCVPDFVGNNQDVLIDHTRSDIPNFNQHRDWRVNYLGKRKFTFIAADGEKYAVFGDLSSGVLKYMRAPTRAQVNDAKFCKQHTIPFDKALSQAMIPNIHNHLRWYNQTAMNEDGWVVVANFDGSGVLLIFKLKPWEEIESRGLTGYDCYDFKPTYYRNGEIFKWMSIHFNKIALQKFNGVTYLCMGIHSNTNSDPSLKKGKGMGIIGRLTTTKGLEVSYLGLDFDSSNKDDRPEYTGWSRQESNKNGWNDNHAYMNKHGYIIAFNHTGYKVHLLKFVRDENNMIEYDNKNNITTVTPNTGGGY